MAIFSDSERTCAVVLSKLTYCNPFLPERIQYEREALGETFVESDPVWNAPADLVWERPNIGRIQEKVEKLAEGARSRLLNGQSPGREDLELYEDLVLYLLYHRTREQFQHLIRAGDPKAVAKKIEAYHEFAGSYEYFLSIPQFNREPQYSPHHLYASYFQVRRAFHHIFQHIVGRSMPAARLRSAVWQSIFTRDIRRYQRVLYDRMADFMTLITGPSGTGKELVARAIGLSRYIPFDPKTLTFSEDFRGSFYPLNISALSPTLVESELFGHRRGAFTGALEDRAGWLETCRPLGSVFLDEVGEIEGAIQVKLLRVLQTRMFQRLGDTQTRTFAGKIIAATNRDVAKEMHAGRIRKDFYYRLCSDVIVTPSLREILQESPEELQNLVLFIATQIMGKSEAETLAEEVVTWINKHLGRQYVWPGNFRELEQCVRNVLVRGEYWPAQLPAQGSRQELASAVAAGTLTADDLLKQYCTLVHSQTHNYEETARRLGIDRRTVKAKIDPALLEELRK